MSSTAAQLRSRLPRLADVAVQRARLTVVPRPRTRPRAPRMPFVVLVSAILLGGVIGLLLFNTSMQQASFRETALQQQASDLTAQEEALQVELQHLRDPQRVAYWAQTHDMVIPAGGPLVIDQSSGKVLGATDQPALPGTEIPLTVPGPKKPPALDPAPVVVKERSRTGARTDDRTPARTGGRNDRTHGVPSQAARR